MCFRIRLCVKAQLCPGYVLGRSGYFVLRMYARSMEHGGLEYVCTYVDCDAVRKNKVFADAEVEEPEE